MKGFYTILLLCCFAFIYPAAGQTGKLGQWLFDEGTGIAAADSSGNGNTATLTNVTCANGVSGSALNFQYYNSLLTFTS